ncbi:MAG TPA: nicotinamide-nucleotide amidohydrolase family protein [Coriobacteriia bacterium]
MPCAAIVTVGTELVTGLVVDTNAAEIGASLTAAGFIVDERVSLPDDIAAVAARLTRLAADHDLVVVTGGLGPTHDDVTREAASRALGVPLERDEAIAAGLRAIAGRHGEARAAEQVYRQADVLRGARVLPATLGTAPGQVAATARGDLVLLPGPPREMRAMLPQALAELGLTATAAPVVLATTGLPESDVQVAAERVLGGVSGIGLTVLARAGEVRAVLFDRGAAPGSLAAAAQGVCDALGDRCFSATGESLAAAVLREARDASLTIATAESCTGGMVAAALTDVAGSSDVFLGSVVSYSNESKERLLRVPADTLRDHGAVSPQTAEAMAKGVRRLTGADVCVSVTGVAGPGGGTPEKPVGLVWFGLLSPDAQRQERRLFPGDRDAVRVRATATALDLVRLEIRRLRG